MVALYTVPAEPGKLTWPLNVYDWYWFKPLTTVALLIVPFIPVVKT
jgi:hypothetical protein